MNTFWKTDLRNAYNNGDWVMYWEGNFLSTDTLKFIRVYWEEETDEDTGHKELRMFSECASVGWATMFAFVDAAGHVFSFDTAIAGFDLMMEMGTIEVDVPSEDEIRSVFGEFMDDREAGYWKQDAEAFRKLGVKLGLLPDLDNGGEYTDLAEYEDQQFDDWADYVIRRLVALNIPNSQRKTL